MPISKRLSDNLIGSGVTRSDNWGYHVDVKVIMRNRSLIIIVFVVALFVYQSYLIYAVRSELKLVKTNLIYISFLNWERLYRVDGIPRAKREIRLNKEAEQLRECARSLSKGDDRGKRISYEILKTLDKYGFIQDPSKLEQDAIAGSAPDWPDDIQSGDLPLVPKLLLGD